MTRKGRCIPGTRGGRDSTALPGTALCTRHCLPQVPQPPAPGWTCAQRRAGAQACLLSWGTAPLTCPPSCPENRHLQSQKNGIFSDGNSSCGGSRSYGTKRQGITVQPGPQLSRRPQPYGTRGNKTIELTSLVWPEKDSQSGCLVIDTGTVKVAAND